MPDDAPPQEEAGRAAEAQLERRDRTCPTEIGAAAATRLAERCTTVSPATPPALQPRQPLRH